MRVITSDERAGWSSRGREFAADPTLFAMADRAVDLLEGFAMRSPPLVALCALRYLPADPRYRPLLPFAQACRDLGMRVRIYAHGPNLPAVEGVEVLPVGATALTAGARRERCRRWMSEAIRKASANVVVCFDDVPETFPDVARFRLSAAGLELLGDRPTPDLLPEKPPAQEANGMLGTVDAAASPLGLAAQSQPSRATYASLRERYGFGTAHVVFVIAGRDLVSRGFERLLVGIGRLPEGLRDRCRVLAAGELENSFHAIAEVLELTVEVDVGVNAREAIAVGDVLVDLPYAASAESWIFDAISAGRPVLTWAGVADSRLLEEADAGTVLAAPYRQADFDQALGNLVASPQTLAGLSDNAVRFAAEPRHYGCAAQWAERISAEIRHRGGHAQTLPA